MKKNFLTAIAAVAIAGGTLFSCASTNDGTTASGTTGTSGTMGGTETTTTGTAGTTTTDDTYGTAGTTTTTGTTGTTTTTTTDDTYGTTETTGTTTTDDTYGTTDQTGTTTGTTGTTGTMGTTGTDQMGNTGGMTTETDRMANTAAYEDLFNRVDNTAQYGILELARMEPNFSTFVQLVEQSGMSASFESAGPITVFLPTNDAFDQMNKEDYDRLTNPQNRADLIKFLNLHVVNQEIDMARFGGRQVIEAGDGTQIRVDATAGPGATPTSPGVVTVGGAEIVRPDIDVSNGVIHVVNRVVSPSDVTGPGVDR